MFQHLRQVAPLALSSLDECGVAEVRAHEVAGVWPHVVDEIKRALDLNDRMAPDHVLQRLHAGRYQLWLVDEEGDYGVIVTSLEKHHQKLVCRIILAAGIGAVKRWRLPMGKIEAWAKGEGACEVEIVARVGWSRVMASEYRETARVLTKELL